jgi:hypothetical protein
MNIWWRNEVLNSDVFSYKNDVIPCVFVWFRVASCVGTKMKNYFAYKPFVLFILMRWGVRGNVLKVFFADS